MMWETCDRAFLVFSEVARALLQASQAAAVMVDFDQRFACRYWSLDDSWPKSPKSVGGESEDAPKTG